MQKFFLAASRSSSRVFVAVFKTLSVIVSAVLLTTGAVFAQATSDGSAVDAGYDPRPVVYLTFDDGPSADFVTGQVLRVLEKYNATATFFVTGQRVRREPEKIAEIVYAGHAIGNHTVNHAKLTQVSDERVISELRDASKIILNAGGPPPTCFRPPFGSTDRRVNKLAESLGMVPVGWSIDTRDWERSISVDAIGNALSSTADDSVVLLHDGPKNRLKMLQALTRWLARHAHEYRFEALPECSPHSGPILMASLDDPAELQSSVSASPEVKLSAAPPVRDSQVKAVPVSAGTEPEPVKAAAGPAENAVPVEAGATQDLALAKAQTIPELLEKIRAYRIVLHDDRQQVDLTQITATLSSEIHGEHIYFSF